MDELPTVHDVVVARSRIRRFLRPTPLLASAALSHLIGADVHVKCEMLQPTGAFKVRGGLNLLCAEAESVRARGVAAASTGNHGQSVAYAAARFGVPATIFAPAEANPLKVAAMQALGAEVRCTGRDYDEAREACEAHCEATGARYVHSMNEPLLIAGVGTAALEALEVQPEIDYLFVPVGGGSGAAGACLVASALCPGCRVIGVQAEGAPALHRSFRERRLVTTEHADTIAEGLQTRVAFDLPLRIMWDRLADFLLVSDRELQESMALALEALHVVVEAAGAAPLAAARRMRDELQGRRVCLILSGGNATLPQLRAALEAGADARR